MNATCGAWHRGKTPCEKPAEVMHWQVLPLCKSHLHKVRSEARRAVIKDRLETERARPTLEEIRLDRETPQVYFIKAGRRIKIGFSTNPAMRLSTIRAGACKVPSGLNTSNARILALESGGRLREAELHRQFAHLREAGEWFRGAPDLTAYIDQLAA
jgi:hypothetical protein